LTIPISEYLMIKQNQDFLINISKIIILVFVSFSLFASAIPFYLGYDDVNYGIGTINLSHGNYGITNDLYLETGNKEFLPKSYVKTTQDNAIPISTPGIYVIGTIFYLIGGFFGLFYFGPIITIILLILFERITSKFFGNLVGLLALLLLIADWQFFFVGLRLLTDNIFSLFFILGVFSIIKFVQNKDYRYILVSSTFFSISSFFRITGIVFFLVEILIIFGFFVIPFLKESKKFSKNYSGINQNIRIFSKSNLKKFIKISFFLFLPWIIFLTFWFSYNDYFFGDAGTNYREQMQTSAIDKDEEEIVHSTSILSSLFEKHSGDPFARVTLLQYYSVPLLPDPMYFFLIITSDTDLDIWRSDIWIAFVSFPMLAVSLIISLHFKIKRKETLSILSFIIILVFFYSSPLVSAHPLAPYLSESANDRYMIPASMLSFILFGFILVESWRQYFSKDSEKIPKIVKLLKWIYLILIILFFLALIITIPSIQDFYQRGFHFNNPSQYYFSYTNLEKLPEKSFIIGYNGRNTLLHTDTHFYPYGSSFLEEADHKKISRDKIQTLKEILEKGYTGYTFKSNMNFYDEKYFKFLEGKHGIVLKDYSETFCKLEINSNFTGNTNNISSDLICFKDVIEKGKKIWNVTLKWPF